jgi:hypothetical protein
MGGRASGGKPSGGQSNSGGFGATGGFGVFTGGRSQTMGGFAGTPTDSFPLECARYCAATGCIKCTPPPPGSKDTRANCPLGLVCPTSDQTLSQRCPFCVECTAAFDCELPFSACDENRTCTRQCDSDGDCADVPDRHYCNRGKCAECKNQDRSLCSPPKPLCSNSGLCVECFSDDECLRSNPMRPTCDVSRGVCLECTKNSSCQFSPQATTGSVCANGICYCSADSDCKDSPFGPSCVQNHCRRCGPLQPCPNGKFCDSNGQCQQ